MVDKSYEYPIHEDVMPSKEIASFGVNFKTDQTSKEFWRIKSSRSETDGQVGLEIAFSSLS